MLRPVTQWMRRTSVSAAWRVRLYFGSHVNRRGSSRPENACLLEKGQTPIFHATRQRVGSISRQEKMFMSFRHKYILINDMLMFESLEVLK